ncbi:MAG: hypothetical protein V1816_18295 [Pseudomonadota bacterium]
MGNENRGYAHQGAPPDETMARSPKAPEMTVGRAALLGLSRRYLAAVMDPFVTLLEIHKLMYFMQEAGEPLRLDYQKGPYGPYARNLRHVLNLMEGHFITGYGDAEDRPDLHIQIFPEALDQAEHFLAGRPETLARFQRVVDLIAGYETPYGLELLAAVQWTAGREGAKTADQAVDLTHAWNDRKKMFKEKHVRLAWETLARKGWLQAARTPDRPQPVFLPPSAP